MSRKKKKRVKRKEEGRSSECFAMMGMDKVPWNSIIYTDYVTDEASKQLVAATLRSPSPADIQRECIPIELAYCILIRCGGLSAKLINSNLSSSHLFNFFLFLINLFLFHRSSLFFDACNPIEHFMVEPPPVPFSVCLSPGHSTKALSS